jgi:hypothetical protein
MDFYDRTGENVGLGFFSEQAFESMHHDLQVGFLLKLILTEQVSVPLVVKLSHLLGPSPEFWTFVKIVPIS